MRRHHVVEGLLFIPAMCALAAIIGGAAYCIIRAGGWILGAAYGTLRFLHIPHALALALAVVLTGFAVGTLFWLVEGRRRKTRLRA